MTKKKKSTLLFLKKDIKNLGNSKTTSKVSSGYARNFLIPKNLGTLATVEKIQIVEKEKNLQKQKVTLLKEQNKKKKQLFEKIKSIVFRKKLTNKKTLFVSLKEKDILQGIYQYTKYKTAQTLTNFIAPTSTGKYEFETEVNKNINLKIKIQVCCF
uniref:Ribosomal protein L9 n=1 Tax=Gloeochaete wittrockiana TaxID=38269 RepID=A0A3G1IWE9_9EUKA|nr:ribosomal protein L9 [Gloeochaete wittrockiana]ASQ40269.1 ribosomal protein L9 [Gloeochaete wittrockiana]